ncbi:MAG: hypothetical protein QGI83_03425, partial [Candidatus Latescibacteria bacterium]|nr:hypothetical protein [Candidatus Latescibacterota bacterium]
SDIGYTWTYRMYATFALGHNLVVVDRETQKRIPTAGCLEAWHPCAEGVQVVEASGSDVYPQCEVYRRALFLIPVGDSDNLVFDIFEVAGGDTHEWMTHGSCSTDQTLEVSVPTEYHAASYADDGEPFRSPNHSDWEMELHAQGLRPMEVNPWYGAFRDVYRGTPEETFSATFEAVDEGLPDVRLHMLEHGDGDLYTCRVPTIRRCWSPALGTEDHSRVEDHWMPKLVVRRDGEGLHSRFVALWEPMRESRVVADVRDLAPAHPEVVAREVLAVGDAGDERIRILYSSEPAKRCQVDDGASFQGRYAVSMEGSRGRRVTLYDCAYLRDGDLEVTVEPRVALPVIEALEAEPGDYAVVLDGTWPDVAEGQPLVFAEPELVTLTQDGAHRRAFPVDSVATQGRQTVLTCGRHPGFRYDRKSTVLEDVFTPFQSAEGEAVVSLPSRVHLMVDAKQLGAWSVQTTDTITVNGYGVERTGEKPRWLSP